MSQVNSSMFAPMGPKGAPQTPVVSRAPQPMPTPIQQQKKLETKKIDSIREEKDMLDMSHITTSSNKQKAKEKELEKTKSPELLQADIEKKQQSMLTTLDQKKKELQKQRETIERLNKELQQLDAPASKEITSLRAKVEQLDKDLAKATKVRKQKEQELLDAIATVSRIADEKMAVSERLKLIMYDFETAKQKKLKELEEQMHKAGV